MTEARTHLHRFLRNAAAAACLLPSPAVAQQESAPVRDPLQARVDALLAEHASGEPLRALEHIDALLQSGSSPNGTVLASRYRLLLQLGRAEEAAAALQRVSELADPNWRVWAGRRAAELQESMPNLAVGIQDIPPRLRRLAGGLIDPSQFNKSRYSIRNELEQIGPAAVPAILEVMPKLHGEALDFGLEALARIGSKEATDWLANQLSNEADPALVLKVAQNLHNVEGDAGQRLADLVLGHPNARLHVHGLYSWRGEIGARELDVFANNPSSAAVLLERDPQGKNGYQRTVWQRFDAEQRQEFAGMFLHTGASQLDPELLVPVMSAAKTFQVATKVWEEQSFDTRQTKRASIGSLLDAIAARPMPYFEYRSGVANRGGVAARSPGIQLIDDIVVFGWSDLAPNLVQLLDSPADGVVSAARRALHELAPTRLLDYYIARGEARLPIDLLKVAEYRHLPLLARAFEEGVGRLGSNQWSDDNRVIFDRICRLAKPDDLEVLTGVHRTLTEQDDGLYSPMHRKWRDWVQKASPQLTTSELLSLQPRQLWTVAFAAKRAGEADRATLLAVLDAGDGSLSDVVAALLRIDAKPALLERARRDIGILGVLRSHDLDRLPVWRDVLSGRNAVDFLAAALLDPQVAQDAELSNQVLTTVAQVRRIDPEQLFLFLKSCPADVSTSFATRTLDALANTVSFKPGDTDRGKAAISFLGRDRNAEHIARYAGLVNSESEELQLAAVTQLGRTFSPRAVPVLIEALKSDHQAVAKRASSQLTRLDNYFSTEQSWKKRFSDRGIDWVTEDSQPDKGNGR